MPVRPPIRIAVLHFSHETVRFLANYTALADFTYPGSPAAGEELPTCDPRGYMGGFVKKAREFEAVELVGIESPLWPCTGTGWIATEAFEGFVGEMIEELHIQGPFDGAYLCVHGADGVRGVPRPEAKRVRAAIGRAGFIAATFDPHGNEDEEFLRQANMAFAVKYFRITTATCRANARPLPWCAPSGATPTIRETRSARHSSVSMSGPINWRPS